ncbi:MAG: flippase-like domain-containing protein [Planctomycetes bacterium]|nr:flippase-like domain-containing protein [Planctomycetota bacterium]
MKIAIAVLLTWYVLGQIENRDRLVGPNPKDDIPRAEIFGNLSGDWRAGTWVFHCDVTAPDPSPLLGAAPLATLHASDLEGAFAAGWELRPGFLTIARGIQLSWFLIGAALWGVLLVLAAVRWRILLHAAGIKTTVGNALRLCFVGYFFNNVMPGVTGGDVVRGALITRGLEQDRWKAALSVVVDRIIGLVALITLAAIVLTYGLLTAGEKAPYPPYLAQGVFIFLGATAIGGSAYLSQRVRDKLGIERWLPKLPGGSTLTKIDNGLTIYRHSPGRLALAYLMSLPLQICGVLSFWAIGQACGASLQLQDDFVIFPVVQTISAIPLAPAGWGVGETLYGHSFRLFGSSFTLGVAVSVLFRLTTQLGFGLIGGMVWVTSSQRKEEVQNISSS